MNRFHNAHQHRQRGFSLVEIMVGMVIGMLGIIVIVQVAAVFESRKKTTTSGDDAQNGGAIALFSLERDIRQAGYGLSSPLLVGKQLSTPNVTVASLVPVIVNPVQLNAFAGTNDTLIVAYGNSVNTEGLPIKNPAGGLPYLVPRGTGGARAGDGGRGFTVGDWVIPSQSGTTASHSMYQVIDDGGLAGVVAVSGTAPSLTYNNNSDTPPILFNLGPGPSLMAYAVINGSLQTCNYMTADCSNAAAWTQLAGDIVSLRASCESPMVRIALVARSPARDGAVVTAATPTWNPNGAPAAVVANPSTSWGGDWDHYRYKTFETLVPIRNAIWAKVQGC